MQQQKKAPKRLKNVPKVKNMRGKRRGKKIIEIKRIKITKTWDWKLHYNLNSSITQLFSLVHSLASTILG